MALPVIYVKPGSKLPDNTQYTNRFEIKSASSNRLYLVAQNKAKRVWSCSCPGWIFHRHCKHLAALALPAGKSFEARVLQGGC